MSNPTPRYDWNEIQKAHDSGDSYSVLRNKFGVTKRSLQMAKIRGVFEVRIIERPSKEERYKRKRAIANEAWARYMSKRKNQTPNNEDIKVLQEFYANCPKGYEVDHIIPISKGGLHTLSNLQYLSKTDNRKKSNKLI